MGVWGFVLVLFWWGFIFSFEKNTNKQKKLDTKQHSPVRIEISPEDRGYFL